MNKFYWMAIGLLLGLVNLRAEIKLPALVGDNMVLQQATKVRLWGNATPNSSLKVRSSWDNTEYTAQVNDQGRWEIWVQTPSASFEKQQLTLENGQDKIVLHDLLIGEVWFGSGQSNMEMPLRGFWHCPIEGGNHAIATSGKYKNSIRYATIQRVGALEPKDYPVGGEWKVCDPRNAPEFGATAYFFATLLTEVLNVPVGIINCSWGGSTVEGWLPKDILRNYSDIDLSLAGNDEKIHPMLQPMIMYNGMLKPASKYTVRGFLWYQGESNVGHPDYAKRLATMVEHWRGLWGQGEIDKDKIILFFKNAEDGFNRDNGIIGFEIAGKDMRFHKANATIDANKKTVIISAPGVKAPIAARYGFRNFQIGNLQNVQGLPVLPFRTDK